MAGHTQGPYDIGDHFAKHSEMPPYASAPSVASSHRGRSPNLMPRRFTPSASRTLFRAASQTPRHSAYRRRDHATARYACAIPGKQHPIQSHSGHDMSGTSIQRSAPGGPSRALHANDGACPPTRTASVLHDVIGQLEQMLLARHASLSPIERFAPTVPASHGGPLDTGLPAR